VEVERRPVGILILALISFVGGVALLFIGLMGMGIVLFGPAQVGDGAFAVGLLAFAAGLLYLAVAGGAFLGMSWVLPVGLVTAVVGLGIGVLQLLATDSVSRGIATIVFPVFLLWYLNRDDVKAALTDEA
jgi:hypothetical protein